MKRVYAKSEEKFVKATIVYQGENNVLYYDTDLANQIAGDDLLELYLRGNLVVARSSNLANSYERAVTITPGNQGYIINNTYASGDYEPAE